MDTHSPALGKLATHILLESPRAGFFGRALECLIATVFGMGVSALLHSSLHVVVNFLLISAVSRSWVVLIPIQLVLILVCGVNSTIVLASQVPLDLCIESKRLLLRRWSTDARPLGSRRVRMRQQFLIVIQSKRHPAH